MAEHNELGKGGEQAAMEFLVSKGYRIRERNWTYMQLEADIIAEFEGMLVVVEVKTRRSTVFGEPEVFVNRQKQTNLIKAADAYIQRYGLEHEVRFDIISVVVNNGSFQVNHLEGAFYPRMGKR